MGGLYDQLRIAFHQVWRRRWLAVAVAWGVCVLGWLVIALPGPHRVFVRNGDLAKDNTVKVGSSYLLSTAANAAVLTASAASAVPQPISKRRRGAGSSPSSGSRFRS